MLAMKINNIELLEKNNNKRGDLFCRLMGDFFHAIGYDEPRYDVQKSGREIDLLARHRLENKIAVAECKAHKDKIGGSDINKFVGSLDAEKRKIEKNQFAKDAIGYFVSLSGFTETAKEQELEFDDQRLILVDKNKIIKELVEGKIIVPISLAIDSLKLKHKHPDLLPEVDLLAHRIGWIWVIYYGTNNTKTHYTFVHAEGKPLMDSLVSEIIGVDKIINNLFQDLTYLHPINEGCNNQESMGIAKQKYYEYIKNECGNIQFEGMPTDKEAGSVKVDLEKIFQPLHLEKIQKRNGEGKEELDEIAERETIGEILNKNSRLAILAKPGGGKSTLIKRIAVAYSFHDRRGLVNDDLPNRSWIPIFIRCRELGEFVSKSITEIIENIPNRAEIGFCKEGFSALISDALQNGSALLLIDGLDEISDDSNRLLFVNQLRTFLARYPNIHIITTSREAGFRVIGGVLSNYCSHYKISSLASNEIESLTIKWHKAIIDDTEKTVGDAIELTRYILKDKRIQVLAENPLLLTTLLFVKRWAGYIPTKKSVLYEEMIKLLLVTWNVEGHEQLDIDEAEPQLAYVAYWMTLNGYQTIILEDLKKCLKQARREMPDILGYSKVSISDFIKRVESRSSLLILSGHKKLDSGSITPVYEFLHLSFQEYLTAKAIVEKYLPKDLCNKTNLDIIKPHIQKENWKEVIPLLAVLSKRETDDLIKFLITESKNILSPKLNEKKSRDIVMPPELLGSCIANEIQINPALLKIAIEWFAKNRYNVHRLELIEIIYNSKFSKLFYDTIYSLFFDKFEDEFIPALGGLLGELNYLKIKSNNKFEGVVELIQSEDNDKRSIGFLSLMNMVFERKVNTRRSIKLIENDFLLALDSDDVHLLTGCSWSLAWIGEKNLLKTNQLEVFISRLLDKWLTYEGRNLTRFLAWALFAIMDITINFETICDKSSTLDKLDAKIKSPGNEYDKVLAYYISTSLGRQFNKDEVTTAFNETKGRFTNQKTFEAVAKKLGVTLKSKVKKEVTL
jgi:hypothetical protein